MGPDLGEWSVTIPLVVDSDAGNAALSCRSRRVTWRVPQSTNTHSVQWIWITNSNNRQIWLGQAGQRFLVIRDRVWGVSIERSAPNLVCIQRSESLGEDQSALDWANERFLTEVRGQRDPASDAEGRVWIDLNRIFTTIPPNPRLPSYASDLVRRPEIIGLTVDTTGVTIALTAHDGSRLDLTVDGNMDIANAVQDGKPVFVLLDPHVRRPGTAGPRVTGPSRGLVASLGDPVSVLGVQGFWMPTNTPTVSANILEPTGDLWIGPVDCRLIARAGKMVGVMMDDAGDLIGFSGPRLQLPRSTATHQILARELKALEDQFRTNGCRWTPDFRVQRRVFLANQGGFPWNARLKILRLSFVGDGIRVALYRDWAPNYRRAFHPDDPGHLQIDLSADYRFVTNRVRTRGEVRDQSGGS